MSLTLSGSGTIGGLVVGGLPDATVTAADLASGAARSNFGAGAVLQVVSATKTDTFSTTSTSFIDVPGLSASITPTSTSSKILVFGRLTGYGTYTVTRVQMRLARNGTAISVGDTAGSRIPVSGNELYVVEPEALLGSTAFYLDSPSSTSAIVYSIQIESGNGAGTVYVNRSQSDSNVSSTPRGTSSITVMEIAG